MLDVLLVDTAAAVLLAIMTARFARTFPPAHACAAHCLAPLTTALVLIGCRFIALLF